MEKESFGEWLQKEREQRGWSQSQFARLAGLNRQVIHKAEHSLSMPRLTAFLALAKALKYSPLFLFRKAGFLPPGTLNEVRLEVWKSLIEQLSPDDEEELRQIAELKIERRKKAKFQEEMRQKPK
jgi:transcriptional regulator with XRE-family HTH domain